MVSFQTYFEKIPPPQGAAAPWGRRWRRRQGYFSKYVWKWTIFWLILFSKSQFSQFFKMLLFGGGRKLPNIRSEYLRNVPRTYLPISWLSPGLLRVCHASNTSFLKRSASVTKKCIVFERPWKSLWKGTQESCAVHAIGIEWFFEK